MRTAHATLADPSLLPRLQAVAESEAAKDIACIVARREHNVKSVDVDRPSFAIVLQGTKQVSSAGYTLEYAAGDMLIMTRPCALDVINRPDPHSGLYLTVTAPFCDEVLQAARLLWAKPVVHKGRDIARVDAHNTADELQAWCSALEREHMEEGRLAITALVMKLCQLGHTSLLAPSGPRLAGGIRELVASQPERDWRSHDFERAFGHSGATLRRRLTDEGTSLREVIVHARLAAALQLLYTTHLPLKAVAAKVGYRSSQSFVRRFQERYGLDPTHIGNGHHVDSAPD